jgi:hypothetical protein
MDRGDWYFIVGTVLALLAFFGVDWKRVKNKARGTAMPFPKRQILFLSLIFASLAMSAIGWYRTSNRLMPTPSGIQIVSQTKIPSDDPQLPFGWEVTIETDKEISPVQLWVICNGDIGKGHGKFLNGKEFLFPTEAPMLTGLYHPDVFNIKWAKPSWKPDDPVVIQLFSKTPIRALSVTQVIYRPNAP